MLERTLDKTVCVLLSFVNILSSSSSSTGNKKQSNCKQPCNKLHVGTTSR
jgi:hypothetical protein